METTRTGIDTTDIAELLARLIVDNRHRADLAMILGSAIEQSGAELGCIRLIARLSQRLP